MLKKKIPILSKEELQKTYTKEELQALKPSARSQIIAYLWANNQVVAYTKTNSNGFTIEFDTEENLKKANISTVLANIDEVVLVNVADEDDEDYNCTNTAQIESIVKYAKKHGFAAKTYTSALTPDDM